MSDIDAMAAARLQKLRSASAPGSDDARAQFNAASDDDLARAFTAKHGHELRYVAAWDRWLLWDGSTWRRDERRKVFDFARLVCREALAEALADPRNGGNRERALRQRFGSAQTVWAVVKLAGTDPRHAVTPDQLDAEPWLLNTPSGIVDLQTGEVGPHDPKHLCTKITRAAVHGAAPTFEQFLCKIVPSAAIRAYLQRLAGYALTGSSREHVLPLFVGTGGNGKGTLTHALRRAMGDYAIEIPAELLTESHNERHPCELAVLHGARFVVGSEISVNRHWNESRVKQLTGGDPISARFIGRDPFEFEPTHTLAILANNKPAFRNIDAAVRRRVHLVPFAVQITDSERDPELPAKLERERDGILAWALAGCREWQRQGLNPPAEVREASESYLEGEDGIAGWIRERCEPSGQIKLTAAHNDYRAWCQSAGMPSLGRTAFGDQLEAHGVIRTIDRKETVIFSRLSLKATNDARFPDDF